MTGRASSRRPHVRHLTDVVDLERAEFAHVAPGHAPLSFHSDGRLLSFDGTYVELFDHVPGPPESVTI